MPPELKMIENQHPPLIFFVCMFRTRTCNIIISYCLPKSHWYPDVNRSFVKSGPWLSGQWLWRSLTQPACHHTMTAIHSSSTPAQRISLQNKNGMQFLMQNHDRKRAGIWGLAAGFRGPSAALQCALGQATRWLAGWLLICPATVSSIG